MSLLKIITVLLVATWQHESHSVSASEAYFKNGAPHVELTHGGEISGSVRFSRDGRPFLSFSGVPYATVPERFHEAQLNREPSWKGTLNASNPGSVCIQQYFGQHLGTDDCLNLNVYVPLSTKSSEDKNVMVWFHGGGFSFGSSNEYDATYFMDNDVIVVTVNYRLGVFGFLSTGDNVIPGNNGLKDMVVALKWVQENIQKFGGSPSKVTIFGESAGGVAVNYLLLSPVTNELFHRAISQSGSVFSTWVYNPNPKKTAVELATYLKCATNAENPADISSEEIFTCLKGLSSEELNNAQVAFKDGWPPMWAFNFVPTAENADKTSDITPFLTKPPMSLVTEKSSPISKVPWMVGANEDEGATVSALIVMSNPELLRQINDDWESVSATTFGLRVFLSQQEQAQVSQKLKQFYFDGKNVSDATRVALRNVYSDQMFLHGVFKSALETASRGKQNPVYLYQYAYKGPVSAVGSLMQGKGEEMELVGHADELVHLFPMQTWFPENPIKPGTPDEEFSKNLVRLWVSFAIHGEPKHTWGSASSDKWKPISKNEQDGGSLRWFRILANPSTSDISQSIKDRMQFWDNLWNDHFTPAILADWRKQSAGQKERTEL